jgi:flagellar protein FliJ
MKKFRFKLQKLLDLRQAQEKVVKNELAKLIHIQNIEKNRQNELRQRISEEKTALRKRMQDESFSYKEIFVYERFKDASFKAINIAERKIQEMEPEIQRVREKLVEASRERKVVEKLKEREFEEYMYEVNRELAKENDDFNQKLYHKKQADDLYQ